ncbi:unnamed protein product [Parajaminaea phylloscopi]
MTSLAHTQPSFGAPVDKTPSALADPSMSAWSLLQSFLADDQLTAHRGMASSAFESPLGVSSIGSPLSTRDFDDESPLLSFDDDFYGGTNAPANNSGISPSDLPLFDISGAASHIDPASVVASAAVAAIAAAAAPNPPPADAPTLEEFYRLYQQHQLEQSKQKQPVPLATVAPLVAPCFANPSSSPLELTGMGATFAALADIAPMSKPWDMHLAPTDSVAPAHTLGDIRRLSLSDSVSGYSSSQDSLVARSSPHSTPAFNSEVSTPMSTAGASPFLCADADNLGQLTADFVRSFARARDTQDTSVLLHALSVAGIHVSEQVLADILPAQRASPASFTSASPVSDGAVTTQVPESEDPAHAHAHAHAHQTKTRSSASSGANKRAALGANNPVGPQTTPHADVIYIHGKRHFRCDVCHKTFDRAFNLKTHRTIHEDQREYPFVCPFAECGKAFARKADCNRHTRSVHLKRGERLRPGSASVAHDLG